MHQWDIPADCHRMDTERILFIRSSADGRLGCFQFLSIKNKAAVCIHVKVFVRTNISFSRGEMPRSRISRSLVCVTFTEKETLPNYVGLCFQQRCGDPPRWLFGRSVFLILASLLEWCPRDFILHFPSNWWCRAPFHILICHPNILFGEGSLLRLGFPHFQKLVYCCVLKGLFILWISPLWNVCFAKIFSLSVAYLFIVYTVPFEEQILKGLNEFQLTHSFFFFLGIMLSAWNVGDLCFVWIHRGSPLCLYGSSFTFRSMIHSLWVNFWM